MIALVVCVLYVVLIFLIQNIMHAGGGKEYTGKDNAQMGLDTLAQTVRDPAVMQEAMKMLSDPSIAAEVQQMMNDPAFQVRL